MDRINEGRTQRGNQTRDRADGKQRSAHGASNKDAEVVDASKAVRLDFELTLLSRTQRAPVPPEQAAPNAQAAEATDPLATAQPEAALTPQGLGLPGMSADAPTESVAVAGNTASPAFGGMFDENRLMQLGLASDFGGERGFDAFGPRGGPGGGRGGFGGAGGRGGPGGRGGFQLGGQRGRRNVNRPNINFGYTLGASALDAAPYSLKGGPSTKPQYAQNRFTAAIGGPLVIKKIINSLNQTYSVGENLGWFRGKHNVRTGGNFRYSKLDSHTATNARGSFTFTGAATGYDFADFLRGLAQLTSAQYGSSTYKFRTNSYDFFVQDDWRILGKLTLNLGLRYDFSSPLTEANNRLVNLDAAPDFSFP